MNTFHILLLVLTTSMILGCSNRSSSPTQVPSSQPNDTRTDEDAEYERAIKELDGRPNFRTPEELNALEAATEYILAGNSGNVEHELGFYAAKVNFYGQGIKDKAFIRQSIEKLNQKWETRLYEVDSIDFVEIDYPNNQATVKLTFSYNLSKGRKHRSGTSKTLIRFDISDQDYPVSFVKEF